jgi:hypothetical protein
MTVTTRTTAIAETIAAIANEGIQLARRSTIRETTRARASRLAFSQLGRQSEVRILPSGRR